MSNYRPLSQIHSEAPFLQLVQKQPAPASCTDAGFARIVDLAKLLGHAAANITIRKSFPRVILTGSSGSPRFDSRKSVSLPEATLINPGFWGIFSEAYNNVKTRMLYDELCARFPPNGPAPHIVELGFMKGQSALLFLEAHPNSTVSSFDLGNYRWSRPLAALLQRAYGKQRLVVTFGYTNRPLPKYVATNPRGGKCDVAFIDGDKTRVGRLKDMTWPSQALYDLLRRGDQLRLRQLASSLYCGVRGGQAAQIRPVGWRNAGLLRRGTALGLITITAVRVAPWDAGYGWDLRGYLSLLSFL